MPSQQRLEEHRQRHQYLHQMFDELLADFISHADNLLSETPIRTLMFWSYEQTQEPDDGERLRRLEVYVREDIPEIWTQLTGKLTVIELVQLREAIDARMAQLADHPRIEGDG